MKTKTLLLSLTTALAISAAAAPAASALETEFIATGTVNDSDDSGGVFGLAGSSLDGDNFTAKFYIDTSKGLESGNPGYDDGVYNTITSPVNATLTINGFTIGIDGSVYSDAYVGYTNQSLASVGADVDSQSQDYLGVDISTDIENTFPVLLGQEFVETLGISATNSGGFFEISSESSSAAYGNLEVITISSPGIVNFTSAAPEPSTWALMIAGVGVIGGALRFGRRSGTLATA